jgi:hydrogenase maturation protease
VNLERVEKIAEAVLYEGYMLYPYRPSSVKNQQRWNFGVLHPPSCCEQQSGSDRCRMVTECLLQGVPTARLTVKVRFLQIVQRSIGKLRVPTQLVPEGIAPDLEPVDHLEFAGRVYQPWQEAVEREVKFDSLDPKSLFGTPLPFSIQTGETYEYLRDDDGVAAAVIVRKWNTLEGSVGIQSECCRDGILKIRVRVQNLTDHELPDPCCPCGREAVLLDSLVSAHTILGAESGEFISLLEPPEGTEDLVEGCSNDGTWPV